MLARRKHSAGPYNLDALCARYGIDNSRRTKHGALLDAELLAEVYLELIGGRQAKLGLAENVEPRSIGSRRRASRVPAGAVGGATAPKPIRRARRLRRDARRRRDLAQLFAVMAGIRVARL